MRTDAAHQRMARVDGTLKDPIPLGTNEDLALALAHLQIEATLAVAQAVRELAGEVDNVAKSIMMR